MSVLRGLHFCFGGPVLKIRAASGRYFTFEMHHYLGPMRLRADGEPARYSTFPDTSEFWEVFEPWIANGQQVDAFGRCVAGGSLGAQQPPESP